MSSLNRSRISCGLVHWRWTGKRSRGSPAAAKAAPGWWVEVPRHRDRQARRYGLEARPPRGTFQVLPRQWVVERTFARPSQCRRLAEESERLPQTSETLIYIALSRLIPRRLARV